jgi:hypothetical protein
MVRAGYEVEAYRMKGGILEAAEFIGRYPMAKLKIECEERAA